MLVGCASRTVKPEPVVPEPAAAREVWVDASASAGGDGSLEHPFKAVPELSGPTRLNLRAGVYQGPFRFEGVQLEGHGVVVLTSNAGETTVTASNSALANVSIQGGDVGLAAGPGVSGRAVYFSGQRREAAHVSGALTLAQSKAVASIEGTLGLVVEPKASLGATGLELEAGFKRGVQCEGGALALDGVKALGVKAVVHSRGCTGVVAALTAENGAGPAVFASGGQLEVRALTVRGHEYGLQLGPSAKVTASSVEIAGTGDACVSTNGAELTVNGGRFSRCGLSGGLLLLDGSTVRLEDVTVKDTKDVGVLARKATLTVVGAQLSGISAIGEALGDALHLRESHVTLERVRVSDVTGSGVVASVFSEVTVVSLEVERAHAPALVAEKGAQVTVKALLVRGGSGAVLVPDGARVTLESLSVAGGSEMPIYAECQAGAEVAVGKLESTVQQLPSRCVGQLR